MKPGKGAGWEAPESRISSPGRKSLVGGWASGTEAGGAGEEAHRAATSRGRGWGRERGRPEFPLVVTPSEGIRAREHLLVLSPKAWSGALSCDWPTGRPSRVVETRADWATAATFSSRRRRCGGLGRSQRDPLCAPSPGEKRRPVETGREGEPEGDDSCWQQSQ